ncbi:hypothetical protein [Paraburkholderia sp. 40]|uniref:hypothetical protein n=1 Tax=Paraburkholderia sp. 40 TaxID=2991059 RepID=UPI003D22D180
MKANCYLNFLAKEIFVYGVTLFSANAGAGEVTLCYPHEEVYFSCPTNGKIMSVCAAGNISPDNGYVQYRFGKIGHVEIEFPEKPYPPEKWFSISDIQSGNLSFTHLKFSSGRYHYVLYQGFPSGIYVKKDGKIISNHICDVGVYQPISPRAFRGIKTAEPIDGIDN